MQVSNRPIVSHDLLKLTLYVVAVLIGGALLSPWLVSGGQWLLATFNPSHSEPPSGLLKEIHKADFSRYFSRATQICAVLLLFPLIRSTGLNRSLIPSWTPARTGQLWASMGLHGGWVFGLKYFSALTLGSKALRAGDHLPWIGLNLKIGLAPLLVITLTGLIVLRLLPSIHRPTEN